MHKPKRPGLVLPPDELSARVRTEILKLGVDGAAKALCLSRETCLILAAGAWATRGSLAIAEQQIAELDQSLADATATVGAP